MPARIVDHAEAVAVGRRPGDANTVSRFISKTWSLPTFSRVYNSHEGIVEGSANPLRRVMRMLDGKFVVVNRRCAVSLPNRVGRVVLDAAALCARAPGAERMSLTLHEPTTILVEHAARGGASMDDASTPAGFFAILPYRLTIALGLDDPARSAGLVDAVRALAAPVTETDNIDWFQVGLCIPDAEALRQMTDDAALFYRWITGRLGSGSRERYWHLDAWEQYTEPGRMHGVVVPEFLRLPRYSAPSTRASTDLERDDIGGASDYGSSLWPPLTPTRMKQALVPPGYCFVEFTARISVCVSVHDSHERAAGPRHPSRST